VGQYEEVMIMIVETIKMKAMNKERVKKITRLADFY
jgi:hypothetical protein